jgi:hypothetical protein
VEDNNIGTQLDGNAQWNERKVWNGKKGVWEDRKETDALAVVPFNPRTDISADALHISGRIDRTEFLYQTL